MGVAAAEVVVEGEVGVLPEGDDAADAPASRVAVHGAAAGQVEQGVVEVVDGVALLLHERQRLLSQRVRLPRQTEQQVDVVADAGRGGAAQHGAGLLHGDPLAQAA